MSRFSFVATLLAVTMGVPVAADPAAQKSADAEMLFQTASHAELVEGDLGKAIRLYREVIAKFAGDRAVAARALVKLGACYEKSGRDEARAAYERVLRDYGDQSDPVRIARARLQQMPDTAPASRAAGPTYRLVLDKLTGVRDVVFLPNHYDFAPDGSRFVFRAPAAGRELTSVIFVADAEGALVRPLLKETGTWWGFQYPRWSPQGNRVAYLVHKAPYEAAGPWGIFVADVDTGNTSQIGADFPDGDPPLDLAWTSDGREITYVANPGPSPGVPTGIYSRSVATGETRVVQTMPVHWSLRLGGYSPDGRWLAFHQRASTGGDQRDIDIWLLPARGGRALKQTEHDGIDAQPAWAPDGRALYFVSDRTGDQNVWKQGVDTATGAPVGAPQQVTFFSDGRVMHPKLFAAGRRMALSISRNKTVIKVASPERPDEARELTRGRAPRLSPDGLRLYYIGEGPEQRGLFAIPTAGGVATRLTATPPAANCGFDLSPDGRTLAYFAKDGSQVNLYTLSTAAGGARKLVATLGTIEVTPLSPPRWSPDGSRIAYAKEQTLFTIPAAGGEPRKVAQLYNWEEWLWAPDGKSIGALAYAAPEDIAVFVVPAEGGEPRRLTPPSERAYKEGLGWHPDGRRLAYMIYAGAGGRDSELREAFVDGRPTRQIVDVPDEWEYVGRWTPDGRYFLYQTLRAFRSTLHAFDPVTGKSRLYIEGVGIGVGGLAHGLMTWSGDGRVVAWATPSITSQLWVAENFR
jgi:Tol biopolymer transport system component